MRYLLLTYYRKPTGQIDEVMAVAKNLKPRDYQTCNVILDFKDQKVIRCTMEGAVVPKDWDKIVSYYYQYYQSTFERLFAENGHELPIESNESTQQT
jgi:hypothetical protein